MKLREIFSASLCQHLVWISIAEQNLFSRFKRKETFLEVAISSSERFLYPAESYNFYCVNFHDLIDHKNILILFIIIINVWLRSHQQMAQQDLPLVSYGFLTGFRGISDLPAPCTFNTGFQPSQSQVGPPWQTVQKGKSNIRYQGVSSENMLF